MQPAAEISSTIPRGDLTKEFVAGGSLFSTGGTRTLPQANDDISRELGGNVYECMLRDPDVAACVMLLVNSVLADGVQINAAVGEKDERFGTATEAAELCRLSIGKLKTFRSTMETMLRDALGFGNKVAEQTYEMASVANKRRLMLKYLKPKPRRTTAFVVDEFMNVLGLAYVKGGVAGFGGFAGLSLSLDGLNILPREKFAVLSLRSEDGDPRGTSSLRPAFNAYNLKSLTYPEYLRFLIQYALPSLIATTGPDARDEAMRDESGNVVIDPLTGDPVMVSPTSALAFNLERFRNGTYLIVPDGTTIKPLEVAGEGEAFLKAFTLYGQEITRAILYQTLATREGVHGTRAESQQKMTVLDMLVWWLKQRVAEMIQEDILKPLVRYNIGESVAEELTPVVSLGDSERRSWSEDASAVRELADVVTDSQWTSLTRQVGIPDPEPGEVLPVRTRAVKAAPVDAQSPDNQQANQQAAQ
jgi:hypothetical protein